MRVGKRDKPPKDAAPQTYSELFGAAQRDVATSGRFGAQIGADGRSCGTIPIRMVEPPSGSVIRE